MDLPVDDTSLYVESLIHEICDQYIIENDLADSPIDSKNELFMGFHKEGIAACYSFGMLPPQIKAFCEIMHDVVMQDFLDWRRGPEESFAYFTKRMIAKSVDRPPREISVFSPVVTPKMVDWMLRTYYSNFQLYKQVLGIRPALELQQTNSADVEYPGEVLPLSYAIHIG